MRNKRDECVDLAPLVPKNISAVMHDVHVNENGARIVAEGLARNLVPTAPFSASSAGPWPEAVAVSERHQRRRVFSATICFEASASFSC